MDTNEINQDLKLEEAKVAPMRNRFSSIDYDLYLVTLPKSRSNAAIYGIVQIGCFQITKEVLGEKEYSDMTHFRGNAGFRFFGIEFNHFWDRCKSALKIFVNVLGG
ncbi:hypothetical protein AVEN_147508-1 [Araneus ventricosus]|uniref:Uncharacterized protein n=1 Tax=Araneus ventricosus TaxID=182803 RepID=A0A4Y2JLY1_ARAVE|nr:hypothetical protein AVEN_147508-1 [Araneus ventricosus]